MCNWCDRNGPTNVEHIRITCTRYAYVRRTYYGRTQSVANAARFYSNISRNFIQSCVLSLEASNYQFIAVRNSFGFLFGKKLPTRNLRVSFKEIFLSFSRIVFCATFSWQTPHYIGYICLPVKFDAYFGALPQLTETSIINRIVLRCEICRLRVWTNFIYLFIVHWDSTCTCYIEMLRKVKYF